MDVFQSEKRSEIEKFLFKFNKDYTSTVASLCANGVDPISFIGVIASFSTTILEISAGPLTPLIENIKSIDDPKVYSEIKAILEIVKRALILRTNEVFAALEKEFSDVH